MSQKAFSSFLLNSDLNVFLEPVSTDSDNSSVVRKRPARARSIGSSIKKGHVTWTAVEGRKNELHAYMLQNTFKEPVIRPVIYALASLGRDEVTHEIKGSTRDELRESLILALKQMPG